MMTIRPIAYRPSPVILLDTAWMPLEGVAEEWGHFGTEMTSVFALRATSAAFAALASETDARERHQEAWLFSPHVDPDSLENALACLITARHAWTDVLLALDPLLADPQDNEIIRTMRTQAMQQRTRVSCLLQEIEREQLRASQQTHERDVEIYTLGKESEQPCKHQ